MKRPQIILIVILLMAGVAFYLWSFTQAKRQSDEIIKKFKEIDERLSYSNDSLKRAIEKPQINFPVVTLKSDIILLIDSLKEEYELVPGNITAMDMVRKKYPDIKRLLVMMQQMNTLQRDVIGAVTADTISYSIETKPFTEKNWIKNYFEQKKKAEVITYLDHLRTETLQME